MHKMLGVGLFILAAGILSCTYLPEEIHPNYINEIQETADYILISSGESSHEGLIFYPGGLVDAHAYLPWMDSLVTRRDSLQIICLKVTANLSILDMQKAMNVLSDFPMINRWVISGHSLGGVVACFTVSQNENSFDALIPMAAWTTENYPLQNWPGAVMSLSASADSLATPSEVNMNKYLFPPEASIDTLDFPMQRGFSYYKQIQGGNHAGFGKYGEQDGDGFAEITVEQQHGIIAESINNFLELIW